MGHSTVYFSVGFHGWDGLSKLIQSVSFLSQNVGTGPQQSSLGVEQTRGYSAFRAENGSFELDGVRNGEIRNRDLNHFARTFIEVEPIKCPIRGNGRSSIGWKGVIVV